LSREGVFYSPVQAIDRHRVEFAFNDLLAELLVTRGYFKSWPG
jgi:hypothetical protein